MTHPGILFVGNFLSEQGSNPTYSEDMTRRLERRAWPVLRTSNKVQKLHRLADMLSTTYSRRREYELAHVDVFSGSAFVWAEAVCFELRRLDKPYVLTLRGGNLPRFAAKWPRRTRRLLASARVVTAPSGWLKAELAKIAPNVVVLPNALETETYRCHVRSHSNPRLIWVRAFHELYNPVMAVEVLANLHDRTAILTMIGVDKADGSLDAVSRRAHELGVIDRLTIVPGVPKREVAKYLAEASIFLNTTNVDNTPISVLEAMASGLCVVSTNAGGVRFVVSDGTNGLLVPPRSPNAMAEAVDRILDDRALATRLSQHAVETSESFDWSHVIAEWEHLFMRVARA